MNLSSLQQLKRMNWPYRNSFGKNDSFCLKKINTNLSIMHRNSRLKTAGTCWDILYTCIGTLNGPD